MKKRWILLPLLLLLTAYRSAAQAPGIPVPDTLRLARLMPFGQPGAASADPGGVLYVADAMQNIVQLTPTGQALQTYSAPVRGRVAALDAGFTGKVLAFYDDRQSLTLFDRFLSPMTVLQFADYPATAESLIRAATLAPDGTIWLYDERQLALVRLDPRDPGAASAVPLDLILTSARSDIRALHAYQNKLYLLDRASGIYVFDIFGAFSRKMALPDLGAVTDVQFRADEVFFLLPGGRNLQFEALYAAARPPRRVALPPAPGGGGWQRVVAGPGGELYLLAPGGIGVVAPPPKTATGERR